MKKAVQNVISAKIEIFIISADIRSSPGDLPFFNLLAAASISTALGGSVLMFREKDGAAVMSGGSFGGGLLRSLSKWDVHNSFTAAGSVTSTPYGS